MASITLGRYVPYESFVHKMDPRAKIFGLIILMVAIFLPYPTYAMSFSIAGILFLLTLILFWISHMSFLNFLKSLAALWFMMIFLFLIYVLVPRTTNWPAFNIGSFVVYWDSILEAGRIFIRLILMISISMILTATTKPLDMTEAFEWYLYPLKLIGFPSHIVAMIITLALRFIPTILDDVDRIMKAQSSRGVDFDNGGLGTKIKAIVSLIIPLFVSSFVRSDELANAMECRGYDPNAKRTKYRKLKFRWWDAFETLVVIVIFAGCLVLSITQFDAFNYFWGLITI